jgi:hypothetical protein
VQNYVGREAWRGTVGRKIGVLGVTRARRNNEQGIAPYVANREPGATQ